MKIASIADHKPKASSTEKIHQIALPEKASIHIVVCRIVQVSLPQTLPAQTGLIYPILNHTPLQIFLASLILSSVSAENVLLLIADDLGRDSIGIFNSDPSASVPPTPAIDSLATAGITFNRMYVHPSCSPTRSSILTGRHEFRTGVYSPGDELQENEFTLAEAIVESGAIGTRLANLGKWHLGGDDDAPNTVGGWPHYAGGLGGGLRAYDQWNKTVNGVTTNRYSVYATSDLVDDAVDWIEDQGQDNWFLWVAFNAPHTPFHKPDNDLHSYDHLDGSETDIANNPRPYYEAMVEAMDTEIGRLLNAIDLAKTTVIFVGDNGTPGQVLQAPFSRGHGKGSLYAGGVNVPMIITGAAVDEDLQATQSEAILHGVDLYLTILDLLGIDWKGLLPDGLVFDSQSFYPVLTGEQTNHSREFAYTGAESDTSSRQYMISSDDYTWIAYDDDTEEFFYRQDGLEETNDRIASLDANAAEELVNFQLTISELVNLPRIDSVSIDPEGELSLEIGWYSAANFSLESSNDLSEGSWQTVDSFSVTDSGGDTLRITHTPDLVEPLFFRVSDD